jgi:hypothetical protein
MKAVQSVLAHGSKARSSTAGTEPRIRSGAPAAALVKFDLRKDLKPLYAPPAKTPVLVEVPELTYVMVEGRGHPGKAPDFQDKIGLLFGLAYTIKFALKKDPVHPFDFAVAPLSGLYWADDPTCFADKKRSDEWKWALAIPLPDRVTPAVFEKGRRDLKEKKDPPHLESATLKKCREGLSAQIMHIGPYSEEAANIKKLHAFFLDQGYTFAGPHHEIYLGDPRRADPAKLKTVLRHGVAHA